MTSSFESILKIDFLLVEIIIYYIFLIFLHHISL